MNGFTFEGKEGKLDSNAIANMLMHLSQGSRRRQELVHEERVFECKTCNRQFPSFQALGGHRASHKRPRISELDRTVTDSKPKVHECSVCGLEFAIGQALGGHMRRHRVTSDTLVKKNSNGKRVLLLDLNLPPFGEDVVECRELGLGLGLGLGTTPIVDFIH